MKSFLKVAFAFLFLTFFSFDGNSKELSSLEVKKSKICHEKVEKSQVFVAFESQILSQKLSIETIYPEFKVGWRQDSLSGLLNETSTRELAFFDDEFVRIRYLSSGSLNI